MDREAPTLYLPIDTAAYEGAFTLIARTSDPVAIVRSLTEAAKAIDARVPVLVVKTMTDRMAVQMWPFTTLSRVFALCGILALLLATAGLAASVAHAVSQRQREFGVRLSIGATPRSGRHESIR